MRCTALKVHPSASTHVLQFLAQGRVGVGTYECKRGFAQAMTPKSRTSATSIDKLLVDSSLQVGEAGR